MVSETKRLRGMASRMVQTSLARFMRENPAPTPVSGGKRDSKPCSQFVTPRNPADSASVGAGTQSSSASLLPMTKSLDLLDQDSDSSDFAPTPSFRSPVQKRSPVKKRSHVQTSSGHRESGTIAKRLSRDMEPDIICLDSESESSEDQVILPRKRRRLVPVVDRTEPRRKLVPCMATVDVEESPGWEEAANVNDPPCAAPMPEPEAKREPHVASPEPVEADPGLDGSDAEDPNIQRILAWRRKRKQARSGAPSGFAPSPQNPPPIPYDPLPADAWGGAHDAIEQYSSGGEAEEPSSQLWDHTRYSRSRESRLLDDSWAPMGGGSRGRGSASASSSSRIGSFDSLTGYWSFIGGIKTYTLSDGRALTGRQAYNAYQRIKSREDGGASKRKTKRKPAKRRTVSKRRKRKPAKKRATKRKRTAGKKRAKKK